MKLFVMIMTVLLTVLSSQAEALEELRILASARITPPAVVERFEQQYGIRVKFEYFESPEALAAYLESNPRGTLALLREQYVEKLVKRKLLQPFNRQQLPNLINLDPDAPTKTDNDNNVYSIAYLRGMLGILYRRDIFKTETPCLTAIFGPKTKITPFAITNQHRDALGSALMYLGYTYSSDSPSAINQAADLLRVATSQPTFMGFLDADSMLRYFKENFIYAALTHNSLAAKAMAENPNLDFIVPKNGGVAMAYVYVMSHGMTKTEAAHKWLNFLMKPEIAAEVSTWNHATTPNLAAFDFLPPEIRNNPILYPPDEVWHQAQTPISLDEETSKLMRDHWSRLK